MHSLYVVLFSLHSLLLQSYATRISVASIQSSGSIGYGKWTETVWCPEGYFAQQASARIEPKQGYPDDGTSMNSLMLICANAADSSKTPEIITPHEGFWGLWSPPFGCGGSWLTGFQLKIEANQGGQDDTAVNLVKVSCMNGQTASPVFERVTDVPQDIIEAFRSTIGSDPFTMASQVLQAASQSSSNPLWYPLLFSFDFIADSIYPAILGFANTASGGKPSANLALAQMTITLILDLSYGDKNDYGSWGDWQAKRTCPAGTAVCGLRLQIEEWQGKQDDTALNNVEMFCCKL